jgi:hypothetical protein
MTEKESVKKAKAKGKPAENGKATADKPKAPKAKGLPRPQLRVLDALAKAGGPLTLAELVKATGVNGGIIADAVGRFDDESRAARDEKLGRPSLLARGCLKAAKAAEGETAARLEMTAAGKKALAEAMEALGGKLPAKAAAPWSKNAKPTE